MPEPCTTTELVAELFRRLCQPFAAIIVEQVKRELADQVAPTPQVESFRQKADEGDYEELEARYKQALAQILELQRQLAEMQSPQAPEVRTPPDEGTCYSCLWFSGKICQRHGSGNLNKHVDPVTDTCEKYKHTKMPRAELIAQVGEPDRARERKDPRVVCERCGHLVRITKAGNLFRHDISGKSLRGRSEPGRAKECVEGSYDQG